MRFVLVLAVLMTACATKVPQPAPAPAATMEPDNAAHRDELLGAAPPSNEPTAEAAEACRARGGQLRHVCRAARLRCVVTFEDAGKKCSNKKDCRGECRMTERSTTRGGKVIGECQHDDDPCGCSVSVDNGKAAQASCRD